MLLLSRIDVSKSVCVLTAVAIVLLASSCKSALSATLYFGATVELKPPPGATGTSGGDDGGPQHQQAAPNDDADEGGHHEPPPDPPNERSPNATTKKSTKLSEDELLRVYTFCTLLPLLEEGEEVEHDKELSETCRRIVSLIDGRRRREPRHTHTRRRQPPAAKSSAEKANKLV